MSRRSAYSLSTRATSTFSIAVPSFLSAAAGSGSAVDITALDVHPGLAQQGDELGLAQNLRTMGLRGLQLLSRILADDDVIRLAADRRSGARPERLDLLLGL